MEEKPTIEINIDMDKECPQCGKKGTCDNGICISCNEKKRGEKMSAKIGSKVTGKMLAMIQSLFVDCQESMDHGYRQADKEPFKVSIGLKLEPGDRGIDIEASISFVTGRVKDKTTGTANEAQQNLFEGGKP